MEKKNTHNDVFMRALSVFIQTRTLSENNDLSFLPDTTIARVFICRSVCKVAHILPHIQVQREFSKHSDECGMCWPPLSMAFFYLRINNIYIVALEVLE